MLGFRRLKILKKHRKKPEQHSSQSLYFDTLPHDVLPAIVNRLSPVPRGKWNQTDVFHCNGVFGETVRRSYTNLSARLTTHNPQDSFRFTIMNDSDNRKQNMESLGDTEIVLVVQDRVYNPQSAKFIDSCRYLRCLVLDIYPEIDSETFSFDSLFAACGGTLEELSVYEKVEGQSSSCMFESIALHCQSLHTLSLKIRQSHFLSFSNVFAKLRKLTLICYNEEQSSESFVHLAQYCPVLEDVELHASDISFALELQSTLRVFRFLSFPQVYQLTTLFDKFPDIMIHLPNYCEELAELYHPEYAVVDWEGILRTCGERLQRLWYRIFVQPVNEIESLAASLINLEELELYINIESPEIIFDAFFSTPKPNLRKIAVQGPNCSGAFDCFALNVPKLRDLSCIFPDTHAIDENELSKLLSNNSHLCNVSIYYSGHINQKSYSRHTATLIRCMNRFPSLRHLSIAKSIARALAPSMIIADACVGLRGRGVKVTVDYIQYLRY